MCKDGIEIVAIIKDPIGWKIQIKKKTGERWGEEEKEEEETEEEE